MNLLLRFTVSILLITFLVSCSGTINTTRSLTAEPPKFTKAYIISTENSQYIKFRFGLITPFGYIIPPDGPAEKNPVIGNTDLIIKQELEKHGITAVIGKKGDTPTDYDLIVEYNDTWRWDMKKILDKLEIVFISAKGDTQIAKSNFNIYKNKELHNFPTPEKEVPKMIKELLNQ